MDAGAGVEWGAGVAGGKADVCGRTSKQVWAIRRPNHQDFWWRRQAPIRHSWRASMKKRVRLAVPARRSVQPRQLRLVRLL